MNPSVDINIKLLSLVFTPYALRYGAMNPQGLFTLLYKHMECNVKRCVVLKAFPCILLWAWLGMADLCNSSLL